MTSTSTFDVLLSPGTESPPSLHRKTVQQEIPYLKSSIDTESMPLPKDAFVINGGCGCGAVRYKLSIPELSQRPLHPYSQKSGRGEAVRLPMTCVDHCNDCRRATGNLLPLWICVPVAFVTASVIRRSSANPDTDPVKRKTAPAEPRGPWAPAKEIFMPGPASSDSFLGFYHSSERRTRSFCGRCGTYLAYSINPMPKGWPDMLDILLGTVDREDLDGHALAPERQLWWDCGIDWVQKLATEGAGGLPIHSDVDVSRDIRDPNQAE